MTFGEAMTNEMTSGTVFNELNPALAKVAARARQDGAEAEVLITRDEKFSVSVQKGALDKFDSGLSQCAGVRVVKDGAEGYCNTEKLSEEALLEAYREALANAEFSARHSGEKDAALGMIAAGANGTVERLPQGWGQARNVEQKIEIARRLEDAALKRDTRVSSVPYNIYVEASGAVRIFNTKGIDCSYEQGQVHAYAYALAKQGDEARKGMEIFFSREDNGLDPEHLGHTAAERAVAMLGATQPPTGVFPVVFESEPAAELIGMLEGYLSGKSVVEKLSLFANDMGQPIASSKLTIVDDPFRRDAPGSRPFDSEGTPSTPLALVEKGVLKSFLLNSVYARKLGMTNTGHAARSPRSELGIGASNLVVQPGQSSRAELLSRYPRMILVNDLAGFHAGFQNGSGDFSLQAEGELWENGKRVAPLANFVVSGNFRELLKNIEDVANKAPKPVSSVITPAILVTGLSIVGEC